MGEEKRSEFRFIGLLTRLSRRHSKVLSIAGLLLILRASLMGADWPQWRGPNRDGTWTETGIVTSFPSTGLIPKWKEPVGLGFSTPIVSRGKLYLSDLVVENSNVYERVLCFNANSGKRVWLTQHSTAAPDWFFNPAQRRGPGSTPLIHKGRVYALSMFFVLQCLDARTGTVLWKRDLATEYHLPSTSLDASPLVEGNTLILPIGGKPGAGVVAFDLRTGREVWKALDQPATWSSPVIVVAGGCRQLIVWMRQSVSSLNPTNGALYWSEPTVTGGSPGFSAVSTPVCYGDRLLISGLMLQLDRTRPAARVLWPDTASGTRRILSDTSTPLFRDDFVYSPRSGGLFVCLEAGTGREVWQTNVVTSLRSGASVHLVPNGSSVFLFTDQGDLVRALLSPAGYTEQGRAHLLEPTAFLFENKFAWAAPAFAYRNIFVRNDYELCCYSLAENSKQSRQGTGR